jgi:hypothetical protein
MSIIPRTNWGSIEWVLIPGLTPHLQKPWLSRSINWARVNQHPPVHQLAVLSIGWAAFLHSVPGPVLTQHCTTVNLFGLLTFDPFYFLGVFLTLSILPSNLITLVPTYPTDLVKLLTCILALPTNPLPTYPLFFHG